MASVRGQIDPGIQRVLAALEVVGSPHKCLAGRALHVAGTNGKGSVCAMTFAALKQAGLSVGLFNSPHLVEKLDAIRLAEGGQDVPLALEDWAELEGEVARACGLRAEGADGRASDKTISLTTFELQVVTVLLLFARRKVDVAVVEVGLGGREDATNVLVDPAVCAISSIAMDHENFLGPTEEDIARHKAGIFKTGRPALTAVAGLSESVRGVIAACAEEANASPVLWVEPAEVSQAPSTEGAAEQCMRVAQFQELRVPLLGDFQRSNAALAVAMLLELRKHHLPLQSQTAARSGRTILDESLLDDGTIAAGIASAKWSGRLEWCHLPSLGRRVLVDGAHNTAAARALGGFVNAAVRKSGQSVCWVVAMSAGKDAAGVLRELLHADEDVLFAVGFSEVDGMPWVRPQAPSDLAEVARQVRPGMRRVENRADLRTALQAAEEEVDSQIVLCGSLYLVADFARLQTSLP